MQTISDDDFANCTVCHKQWKIGLPSNFDSLWNALDDGYKHDAYTFEMYKETSGAVYVETKLSDKRFTIKEYMTLAETYDQHIDDLYQTILDDLIQKNITYPISWVSIFKILHY